MSSLLLNSNIMTNKKEIGMRDYFSHESFVKFCVYKRRISERILFNQEKFSVAMD